VAFCKRCKHWRPVTPDAGKSALARQEVTEKTNLSRLKYRFFGVSALSLLAAAILLWITVFVPRGNYHHAVGLMESGSYLEAREAFDHMGSYSDSASRVKVCDAILAVEDGNMNPIVDILASFSDGNYDSNTKQMIRNSVKRLLEQRARFNVQPQELLKVLKYASEITEGHPEQLRDIETEIQLGMTGKTAFLYERTDANGDNKDELAVLEDSGEFTVYRVTETGPEEMTLSPKSQSEVLLSMAQHQAADNLEGAYRLTRKAVEAMDTEEAVSALHTYAEKFAGQLEQSEKYAEAAVVMADTGMQTELRELLKRGLELGEKQAKSMDIESGITWWLDFEKTYRSSVSQLNLEDESREISGELYLLLAQAQAMQGKPECTQSLKTAIGFGADVLSSIPTMIDQFPNGLIKTNLRLIQADYAGDHALAAKIRDEASTEATAILNNQELKGLEALRMILMCEENQLDLSGVDVVSKWRTGMLEASSDKGLQSSAFVMWTGGPHEDIIGNTAEGDILLLSAADGELVQAASYDTSIETATVSVISDQDKMLLVDNGSSAFSAISFQNVASPSEILAEYDLTDIRVADGKIMYGKELSGSIPRSSRWEWTVGTDNTAVRTGIDWMENAYPFPDSAETTILRWIESRMYQIQEETQLLTSASADETAGRNLELTAQIALPSSADGASFECYQEQKGLSRWRVAYPTREGLMTNIYLSVRQEMQNDGTSQWKIAGVSVNAGPGISGFGADNAELLELGTVQSGTFADRNSAHTYKMIVPTPSRVSLYWQYGTKDSSSVTASIGLYSADDLANSFITWRPLTYANLTGIQTIFLSPGIYYLNVRPVSVKNTQYTIRMDAIDEPYIEIERNNTPAQATPMEVNVPYLGALQTNKDTETGNALDVDVFSVEITERGKLQVLLEANASSGTATRYLFGIYNNIDGSSVAEGVMTKQDTAAYSGTAYVSPGKYYIQVAKGSAWYGGVYKLTAQFEAQDNIETEPNNIRESANRIQPGQTVSGSMGNTKDTDWFTFDLDVPALVQPVLTFSPMESNTKAFALTLYHGNTVVQKIDYKGKEYSKVVMPVSLDPGNYMIELSNAGGVIKDYTLKLAYQSVDHAEGEPNNDMSIAKQMPIGEVITGTFTGSSDTDWYAFHCDAAGIYNLNIQMEGVSDSKTVCAMQISSGGGETQSISIKGSGFDQNIKISQAGTYYIKLSPKSDISCVYTIAINQAAE